LCPLPLVLLLGTTGKSARETTCYDPCLLGSSQGKGSSRVAHLPLNAGAAAVTLTHAGTPRSVGVLPFGSFSALLYALQHLFVSLPVDMYGP